MDDFDPMGVFNPRNELLEETTGLRFRQPTVVDDVVEELAPGVF